MISISCTRTLTKFMTTYQTPIASALGAYSTQPVTPPVANDHSQVVNQVGNVPSQSLQNPVNMQPDTALSSTIPPGYVAVPPMVTGTQSEYAAYPQTTAGVPVAGIQTALPLQTAPVQATPAQMQPQAPVQYAQPVPQTPSQQMEFQPVMPQQAVPQQAMQPQQTYVPQDGLPQPQQVAAASVQPQNQTPLYYQTAQPVAPEQMPQQPVQVAQSPQVAPAKVNPRESSDDLYRKYRPQTLDAFFGQEAAAHSVHKWFTDPAQSCPQAILITGASGVGKSTLARIIANMLGAVTDFDYKEYNIGDDNGIDLIRELSEKVQYRSHTGGNRVFFLDETALMRKNAQQALLKVLEQLPKKIYIILATTHPQSLEPTVRNRCVALNLNQIDKVALGKTLDAVLAAENRALTPKVRDRLIEVAGGSARNLLTLLQRLLTSDKEEGQIIMLNQTEMSVEGDSVVYTLGQMFAGWKPVQAWQEIQGMLKQIDFKAVATTPEACRNTILGCCKTAILQSQQPQKIAEVIQAFRHNYFNVADAAVFISDVFFAYCALTRR